MAGDRRIVKKLAEEARKREHSGSTSVNPRAELKGSQAVQARLKKFNPEVVAHIEKIPDVEKRLVIIKEATWWSFYLMKEHKYAEKDAIKLSEGTTLEVIKYLDEINKNRTNTLNKIKTETTEFINSINKKIKTASDDGTLNISDVNSFGSTISRYKRDIILTANSLDKHETTKLIENLFGLVFDKKLLENYITSKIQPK